MAPGWTEPPWSGWIETTGDALLILEAARRGLIPRVTRRLVDAERRMITSGSVFVFDEDESGIKRWTDGFFWSPSRILGNFLLYRETDKKGSGHGRRRGVDVSVEMDIGDDGGGGESLSRPRGETKHTADRHRERTLMGSLTNNYKFKPDGLMKKTFSVNIAGVAQHLISYYKVSDVESGRLRAPSSLPELATLEINPTLLERGNFRCAPKIEFDPDGVPRYRGEADEILAGHDVGLGGGIAPGGRSLGSISITRTRTERRSTPRHASEGAVPRKRRQEVDGDEDEDGQDENGEGQGEDDAEGEGEETEDEGEGDVKTDRQEDGKEREKEKGVGREVFLDFSAVTAASQKQESLNTGNVDASAASSAPAPALTLTPVPASTDPGQQLKASPSPSPRARHSPRTNPGVLASATRTLVAARSALAMTSSSSSTPSIPPKVGWTPAMDAHPAAMKRSRQNEARDGPPAKRARSASGALGSTAYTPAPSSQSPRAAPAQGFAHPVQPPQRIYNMAPPPLPQEAHPPPPPSQPSTPAPRPAILPALPPKHSYPPASSSSSSLAAAAAAYSQQFAQPPSTQQPHTQSKNGQNRQEGNAGPQQGTNTGGGGQSAQATAGQKIGQSSYNAYAYPWGYHPVPSAGGGGWAHGTYGVTPYAGSSQAHAHARPAQAQAPPTYTSTYTQSSPSFAQHTLHTQPRVSQARYGGGGAQEDDGEDDVMDDEGPESEEGVDEDRDGDGADDGMGEGDGDGG